MKSKVTFTEYGFNGARVEVTTPVSFDEVFGRLRALCGKSSIAELLELAKQDISEEKYVSEVERRFVGESGFMLFSEINHGGWIPKFGIRRRSVRWILGNPLIAITMLRHDITAGLFAPVELLVTECNEEVGSVLIYVRPSSLIVISDEPELKVAAQALDRKFEALIARATAQ